MAWFVKIDNKEDFIYLRRLVGNWDAKCKDNISAYVEIADTFSRLDTAFEQAIEAAEVTISKPAIKEEPKPRAKRTVPIKKHIFCNTHLTYQALRPPRTDCQNCWAAFEKYAGIPRAKQARMKFDRKNANEQKS